MRIRRTIAVALGVAVLALVLAGPALGARKSKFRAKPFEYDPTASGIVSAAWITHQGLGDRGKSDHALFLQKNGPTATDASAGAAIHKVQGITLTELGFDYQVGSHCGAGAPRFNVTLTNGATFFFGCAHGDATPAGTDRQGHAWIRVRFINADAFPADGVSVWPGFGAAQVQSIAVVFDEGTDQGVGFAWLDNIDVNGKLMGKPGNSRN